MVLAFSYRVFDSLPNDINSESIEKDLIFIGLMGIIIHLELKSKMPLNVSRQALSPL